MDTDRRRVLDLLEERNRLRAAGAFEEADRMRQKIEAEGFAVRDGVAGSELIRVSLPAPDRLVEPPTYEISVQLLVEDWPEDTQRCVRSLDAHRGALAMEIVLVDNASDPSAAGWLAECAQGRADVQVVRLPERLGFGGARNAGLRQARGATVILLDTSVELTGDAFSPILAGLADERVGAVGGWGVRTSDLRHFHDTEAVEVDALEGYCFAFHRDRLKDVGLLDEKFKFYRNADLDYSFAFRARGYALHRVPGLPLARHQHRGWSSLPEAERERLSKRNFYRFLDKWRDRADLLVSGAGFPSAAG